VTTTPGTKHVCRDREGATDTEIDGFRAELITADHSDCDAARAAGNPTVDRRPGDRTLEIGSGWSTLTTLADRAR
jgi:hypothetical protein